MLVNTIFIISEREGWGYYAFLTIDFVNKPCAFENNSCAFENNSCAFVNNSAAFWGNYGCNL